MVQEVILIIVGAIIGAGLSLLITRFYAVRKVLHFQLTGSQIISKNIAENSRVQIMCADKVVIEPWLFSLNIWNNGNVPIEKIDYVDGHELEIECKAGKIVSMFEITDNNELKKSKIFEGNTKLVTISDFIYLPSKIRIISILVDADQGQRPALLISGKIRNSSVSIEMKPRIRRSSKEIIKENVIPIILAVISSFALSYLTAQFVIQVRG